MKLTETTLTETAIRMRYADSADPAKATQWLDFQVPLAGIALPAGVGEEPLGDPERQLLAEVRLAALRYARGLIGDETRRISELLDRRH